MSAPETAPAERHMGEGFSAREMLAREYDSMNLPSEAKRLRVNLGCELKAETAALAVIGRLAYLEAFAGEAGLAATPTALPSAEDALREEADLLADEKLGAHHDELSRGDQIRWQLYRNGITAGINLAAAAVVGVTDDYMTSEAHHPDYVLLPVAKFEQLRALETALQSPRASDEPKVGQHVTLKTGERGVINRVAYHVQLDEPDGSQGPMGGSVGMYECEGDEISPRASDEVLGEAGGALLAAARAVANSALRANSDAWVVEGPPMEALNAALSASPVPVDASGRGAFVPSWLIGFLNGEHSWPGHPEVWFGDRHPDHRGAFFWRASLPKAHTAPVADAQAGEGK